VSDQKAWKAFEGQTVCARAEALFEGTDGPLDLADMAVGGDDVEANGEKGGASALELVVAMNVADGEATRGVASDDGA
jgi:hypothetical protein